MMHLLTNIFVYIFGVLSLLIWYGVLTLPGTFLIYFLWKPTRRISSGFSKYFAQSALIAAAYAPIGYGHVGPIPAVIGLIGNEPMFRGQAIASLLLVLVISFAVLTIRAFYRNRHTPDRIVSS